MIVFRADGNDKIGLGHIMRCLSIADAFKEQGKECVFVVSKDSIRSVIDERGFDCFVIDSLAMDMPTESMMLLSILETVDVNIIIVDSYYVNLQYLDEIHSNFKIAYIDDLYYFDYPVDYLINYSLSASFDRYRGLYKNNSLPLLLLGKDYVPLRKEFRAIPPKKFPSHIKNILVSTGGSDSYHIALDIVKYLQHNRKYLRYRFHIVVGQANKDVDQLMLLSASVDNVLIHRNVSSMSKLKMSCDAAISASGSTLFELCVCGLPIVTYTIADNQLNNEQALVEAGVAVSAGDVRKNQFFITDLLEKADYVFSDIERCREMTAAAQRLIDGNGVKRIVEIMINDNRQ